MPRRLDPLQERFRAAIEETWRMAPLGQWMMEHHAEVARLLRGHREPPWDRLAADFAAAGLTDGRGRKPDAETARVTWEAVCAARPGPGRAAWTARRARAKP
jgi:hypothetical protein